MNKTHSGSCLCGVIRFKATGPLRGVVYCHCTQCRKQSGHYFAATNVADDRIEIEGSENVSWYEASEFVRRGFCRTCGSLLFWKAHDLPNISVMAGLFDDPTSLKGECHIFTACKGDYYDIDDNLPRFEQSTPTIKVAGD